MESLGLTISLFLGAVLVIAIVGIRMTAIAELVSEKSGLGAAFIGVLFLGGSNSLAGLVTSVSAAAEGHAELAISNAFGGIAVQTAFLAIADITYRQANLKNAVAGVTSLSQLTLLVTLLIMPLLGMASPNLNIFGIHPISFLLIAIYILGLRWVSKTQTRAKREPYFLLEKHLEAAKLLEVNKSGLAQLWLSFLTLAAIIAIAGYVVEKSGVAIASSSGISETVIGSLLTAICTSLPELVTCLAAVRRNALILAFSSVIGGNCFDVLFVAFSDFAYRPGSIYNAIASNQVFVILLPLLLTAILFLGLWRQKKYSIANISYESFVILILYISGFSLWFYQN